MHKSKWKCTRGLQVVSLLPVVLCSYTCFLLLSLSAFSLPCFCLFPLALSLSLLSPWHFCLICLSAFWPFYLRNAPGRPASPLCPLLPRRCGCIYISYCCFCFCFVLAPPRRTAPLESRAQECSAGLGGVPDRRGPDTEPSGLS